jgi:hypothetical protein
VLKSPAGDYLRQKAASILLEQDASVTFIPQSSGGRFPIVASLSMLDDSCTIILPLFRPAERLDDIFHSSTGRLL